jgi:hypothetical protein
MARLNIWKVAVSSSSAPALLHFSSFGIEQIILWLFVVVVVKASVTRRPDGVHAILDSKRTRSLPVSSLSEPYDSDSDVFS